MFAEPTRRMTRTLRAVAALPAHYLPPALPGPLAAARLPRHAE